MRPALTLRVHALLEHSYANGPGCRAVLWVQGCSLHCPGCCNPDAQAPEGGRLMPVAELVAWVKAIPDIEGITFSGGEPLQQSEAVEELLREVRATADLSVVMFTGYDWEHLQAKPAFREIAALCDVVITGPYRRDQPHGRGQRGSANQTTMLVSNRYSLEQIEEVPEVEVVVGGEEVVGTGVEEG